MFLILTNKNNKIMKQLLLKILNRMFLNTLCGNRTFNEAFEVAIGPDTPIEYITDDENVKRIKVADWAVITLRLNEYSYVTNIAVDDLD